MPTLDDRVATILGMQILQIVRLETELELAKAAQAERQPSAPLTTLPHAPITNDPLGPRTGG